MTVDPLEHYLVLYKPDHSQVAEFVFGEKYVAVMLKNGNIGVCGITGEDVPLFNGAMDQIDLQNYSHRVFYNAWLNAFLNYREKFSGEKDIFEEIDFSEFRNIVMIGYFNSLYEKIKQKHLRATVFDLNKSDEKILNIELQDSYISNADCLILSATSISNNTFNQITIKSPEGCRIFVLGPSSILDRDILAYKNVSHVFGSVFMNGDERVLQVIRSGGGTKEFMKYMRKVFVKN